jgi:hypothetical protein
MTQQVDGRHDLPAFDELQRTKVYRAVPFEERASLDAMLILRPVDCSTVESVADKLDLATRFGLCVTDIRLYARRLEAFARPMMAGLAFSALVRALPPHLTEGLGRTSHVVIWSRLVQHLSDEKAKPLTASEFAKLAALLSSPRPAKPQPVKPGGDTPGNAAASENGDDDVSVKQLASMADLVYGVSLASDDVPQAGTQAET